MSSASHAVSDGMHAHTWGQGVTGTAHHVSSHLQDFWCVCCCAGCRNAEGIAAVLLEVHRAKGVPFRSNKAGWNPLILAVMNFA
jgi:hypothetical protein